MEIIYVIIKHEEHTNLAISVRNATLGGKPDNAKYYTHEHLEKPLCFDTEKEAAERIKKKYK